MRRGMLSLSLEGSATVVEVHGDLDITTSEPLRSVLHQLEGEPNVVVDIRDVDFCDSSGVAVLENAARHASSLGTAVLVRRPQPSVEHVLRLCGCEWLLAAN